MLEHYDSVAYHLLPAVEISSNRSCASLYFSANFDNEQSAAVADDHGGLQLGEVAGGLILTMSTIIGVQGLVSWERTCGERGSSSPSHGGRSPLVPNAAAAD